jgi:hypothetical protein
LVDAGDDFTGTCADLDHADGFSGNDLMFTWTSPGTASYCASTEGSSGADTLIYAITSSCMSEHWCDDESPASAAGSMTLPAIMGTRVYLVLDENNAHETGDIQLSITFGGCPDS